MLKNYFKIAVRNLWRNRVFSLINILGLAIGLATCMLISLYVLDELSYDSFHEKAKQIYRINSDIKFGGNEMALAVAPDPMGATLVKDFPQVLASTRFRNQGSFLVKKGNQNIKEQNVIYADATIFDVFSLPMLTGNPQKALMNPNSVVITERIAQKYFGTNQALGKVLLLDNSQNYKITGIIKDIPANSHFNFDFFLSMEGLEESKRKNWLSHNFNTYIVLHEKANPKELEAKLDKMIDTYIMPQASQIFQIKDRKEFEKTGNYLKYSLMPLSQIHLHSDRIAELGVNSSREYVLIFSIVAVLILTIACINFMNLSTAKSANRAKEVGIRKVLGAYRSGLIQQFLCESLMLTGIALILAVVFCELLLPWFNDLANKQISLSLINVFTLGPALFVFALVVGLLAGFYPAFYLSSFHPVNVLKGKLSAGMRSKGLRSVLVVSQFSASIILIICTLIIYRQLNYIQNKKLGFNKDQVLIIDDAYALGNQLKTFKNEILRMPEVQTASISGYLPTPSARSDFSFFPEGTLEQDKAVSMQYWRVDHDYIKTMGMDIAKGRDFSPQFPSDSSSVIINETAAKLFGYDDPIGKKISTIEDFQTREVLTFKIVGIVKNFHFESLRQNVGALCMRLGLNGGKISIRMKSADIKTALVKIENQWKKMAPTQPFAYTFLDDSFDTMYRTEQQVAQIFISFAVLAIFLACLGLFGLASYSAEQRSKEVGIRKVLGATISNIVFLLSGEFTRLVFIAFVIAVPLSYYVMNQWLQDFAYRIDLGWLTFVFAGILSFLVAFLTIVYQAIKAALANPVEALRNE